MPRLTTSSRHRAFCWTINNPTDADHAAVADHAVKDASYLCYGKERGASGTDHLQGYVHFKHPVSPKTANRRLGGRAHVEPRREDVDSAINYCKKEGNFFEWGDRPKQGKRTDLDAIRNAIDAGATELELAESYFSQWVYHRKSFEHYRALRAAASAKPRDKPVIHIYWGATGTGKSTKAKSDFPGAFWVTRPNSSGGAIWWDGYAGQRVVVIDEFYGWISYDLLLRILDSTPLSVQVKGGIVPFVASEIVITSNKEPTEWYPGVQDQSALRRHLREFGKTTHFMALGDK